MSHASGGLGQHSRQGRPLTTTVLRYSSEAFFTNLTPIFAIHRVNPKQAFECAAPLSIGAKPKSNWLGLDLPRSEGKILSLIHI